MKGFNSPRGARVFEAVSSVSHNCWSDGPAQDSDCHTRVSAIEVSSLMNHP